MLDAAFWSTFGSSSMCQAISRSLAALPRRPERIAVALSGGARATSFIVFMSITVCRRMPMPGRIMLTSWRVC
jgi:hypothetical protein